MVPVDYMDRQKCRQIRRRDSQRLRGAPLSAARRVATEVTTRLRLQEGRLQDLPLLRSPALRTPAVLNDHQTLPLLAHEAKEPAEDPRPARDTAGFDQQQGVPGQLEVEPQLLGAEGALLAGSRGPPLDRHNSAQRAAVDVQRLQRHIRREVHVGEKGLDLRLQLLDRVQRAGGEREGGASLGLEASGQQEEGEQEREGHR